jgi:DNA-binding GntR family transcriptional regulator
LPHFTGFPCWQSTTGEILSTLSQEFEVNRRTAAKALVLLEDEGLLTRVPGLGYYVNRQPPAGGR